ncbi:MAG: hypothetical protein NAG76_22465 [Candidatus Pristimantibacillus lignocellulolyticus]|uniref:Uncharacterized protein n=1 Tax=Candidatus Pristimantibacillus lignocellulolyticus TaxID=2994561 RepID=A0A9J6ZEG4_9BACL|nr:MAG: hypothetical protein NAG76_22465 [Candidatus Pristimantibacillus lignocellulolyticus]
MRKRLKKKIENSYNALNEARRQRFKRKGIRCIRYEFLPIGERDRFELTNDEISPDYPYATHWLIETFVWENSSQIRIFPCSKNGGTTSISPVRLIVYFDKNVEQILDTFKKVIEDMKSDRFWNTIY